MTYLLHNGVALFVVFVVILIVGAWAVGRALATTWRPLWQALPYAILLALAGRFVFWGLSGGNNDQFRTALSEVYIDIAVLFAVALAAYRLVLARKMIVQYPWLYEPAGPFAWREKKDAMAAR